MLKCKMPILKHMPQGRVSQLVLLYDIYYSIMHSHKKYFSPERQVH